MPDRKFLSKAQYSPEELSKKKRQLAVKKGQVTKARNIYQTIKEEFNKLDKEYTKVYSDVEQAKQKYHESESHKAYMLAQAQASDSYKDLQNAQNTLNSINYALSDIGDRLDEADEATDKAQDALDKFEEEFTVFMSNYERVNNPISYQEVLREHIDDSRKNREQARYEMENWSRATRAASIIALVLFTIVVIFSLVPSSRFDIIVVFGLLGGPIYVGVNRLFHRQYNDAKKRFDKYSVDVNNLQRELLGLSANSTPPSTNVG